MIGASLLAGGAILVSQGIVSQRQTAVRLNQSGAGQVAVKNIMDNLKSFDNNMEQFTGNVHYFPRHHRFIDTAGNEVDLIDLDPRDGLITDTGPVGDTVLFNGMSEQMAARYFFTPVWRPQTDSSMGIDTDWVFDAPMAGNLLDVALPVGTDELRISRGFHEFIASKCTADLEACRNEYENDASIVMARSVNTWQSLNSAASRLSYLYNLYPEFCTETQGIDLLTNWNTRGSAETIAQVQALVDQLIPTPTLSNATVNALWVKIEEENLLNKETSCANAGSLELIPPSRQNNSGSLNSIGLRATIQLDYTRPDPQGNPRQEGAILTNSFSQGALGVPSVVGVSTSVLPYDSTDP